MERARRQREAVEAIQESGGEVFYDYEVNFILLAILQEPRVRAWLLEAFGYDFFFSVDGALLRYRSHETIQHLTDLPNLKDLYFLDTPVTDADLESLKGFTKLTELELVGTHVTDAGLVHLRKLSNLKHLDLRVTQVTPDGVKKLQKALPDCEIEY
ncbi:MAG: hypothetical protein ABIP48_27795 [Planctomycetota bacterium]